MNAEAKPKEYSVMRHSRPALIVGSLLFCFGVNYLYTGCKPAWQFDRLEPRARQVITGAQLQNWATNLIASHPNKSISFRLEDLGTNFPAQLRNLAPKLGPRIYLYEGRGENEPPSIRIYWGSGFLGSTGFEIGPPNFIGGGRQWLQAGVYFYKSP